MLKGIWHAHVGWLFETHGQASSKRFARDLLEDRTMRRPLMYVYWLQRIAGSLLAKTGYTTFDRGSSTPRPPRAPITYIDGDAGILRYRGYPIEQLAEKSTFIEVSYLLIYGELPTAEQLDEVHQPDPAAHPAARGPQAVLRRLPAQRAPDAGAVQRGQRAERLLPGLAGSVRRRAGRAVDHPAAGQAADHRGLRVQEVRRPAVPVPGQLADAWSRTSCG